MKCWKMKNISENKIKCFSFFNISFHLPMINFVFSFIYFLTYIPFCFQETTFVFWDVFFFFYVLFLKLNFFFEKNLILFFNFSFSFYIVFVVIFKVFLVSSDLPFRASVPVWHNWPTPGCTSRKRADVFVGFTEALGGVKNLKVTDPTTSSLKVRWEPAHGNVRHYRIFYVPASGGAEDMVRRRF